jgi:hypothetical protein
LTRELVTSLGPKALQAEEIRLARRFKSIRDHRAALEFAIAESFGGELDQRTWRQAFDSSDPTDLLRTMAITGSYSAIVNAYVEILKTAAGSRLIGLLPHRRPHADQVFSAVQDDGGLSEEQVTSLHGCYVLEGRIEHASPDVAADEVREAVERLLKALPGLIEGAVTWLESYGITFDGERR